MKKNMSSKPQNKKSGVCLILFFFVGVQLPFAKPLVHAGFAEQSKYTGAKWWDLQMKHVLAQGDKLLFAVSSKSRLKI